MKTKTQEGREPTIRGTAGDHHLIQDDIVAVEPVPVELRWSMSDEEFDKYSKAISEAIRLNQEFQNEALRRFLKKSNIPIYPLEDVVRLLKRKENGRFVFLTESDKNKEVYDSFCPTRLGGASLSNMFFSGFLPLRIIERINLVLREFPRLYCFISYDKDNSCQEVFVAVTFGKDFEVFVIDKWNKDNPSVIRREA